MKVLFVFPNIDLGGYKPLALSRLIPIAKRKGCKIEIYDTSFKDVADLAGNNVFLNTKEAGEEVLNFIPVDVSSYNFVKERIDVVADFKNVIERFHPDIIALSIFSQEYLLGMRLLSLAKSANKNIVTIVGGIHCYADPEEVISNPNVDYMCYGEGEVVFEKFLDMFRIGIKDMRIKGLWCKESSRAVKRTYPDSFVKLDEIPFQDYDDYDERQLYRVYNGRIYRCADISLTRGCFARCVYCLHDRISETYGSSAIRHFGVDRLVAELKYLKERYKLEFIRFQDSSFLNIGYKLLDDLCGRYKKEVGLPFVIDSTPQSVTDEKIKLLKEMNCQSISVGVEVGSENLRINVLNKKVTNEQIYKAFTSIHKYGIRTVGFFLIGFPFETRGDIFESIKLIKKAKISAPNVGFVYPFKGSRLRKMAIDAGFFDENIEKDGSPQYSRNHPSIRNPSITEDEYFGIYRTFMLYCKLPGKYDSDIAVAEKLDDIGNEKYRELRRLYYDNELFNRYSD